MASVYYSHGSKSEQLFHEDLVVESLKIYGQQMFYIPRTLVAKDEILGEDRLSEFKTAYSIDMYLENVDGFDGQGAFIQKFGLFMEQSATLVVARRTWEQLIGRHGKTIIPTRPCEGDLLYFPLTNGLFEIKFVQHQDPFYQIGKLFVYKLQVELFQYASEKINTGYKEIDAFENLKTFDLDIVRNGRVREVHVTRMGTQYGIAPIIHIGKTWETGIPVTVGQNIGYGSKHYIVAKAGNLGSSAPIHKSGTEANGTAELKYLGVRATAVPEMKEDTVHRINVTASGSGYTSDPEVFIQALDDGNGAVAVAIIHDIDDQQSYGDNNKFKEEAVDILFNEDNPFGEIKSAYTTSAFTADSNKETADEPIISVDEQ